jgi:general secretion pathway protein C
MGWLNVDGAPPGAAQATPPEDYREVLRHALFTHPEQLLTLVGATVVVEGGRFRGYRVMQPENPAFLGSLGLKPGDILTGVNGVPLNDTRDYGVQVLDALSGTDKLTCTVQRGKQTLVVSD